MDNNSRKDKINLIITNKINMNQMESILAIQVLRKAKNQNKSVNEKIA